MHVLWEDLGLNFLKLQAANPPKHLFATCRDPGKANDLTDLAKGNPNLHVLQLEISDHSAYEKVAEEVSKTVKDEGLNLLINNAGNFIRLTAN